MEVKEYKGKVEIVYKDDIENVFSDIIEINVVDDSVSFSFGVRQPNSNKAVISHRIFLTFNHFLRFSDICSKSSEQLKKNLMKLKT